MKTALLAAVVIALSACASGPDKAARYTYNEIQVVNNSSSPVGDLTLAQPGSGEVFECGDIPAYGICQHYFGRRPYLEAPFEVRWSFADGPRQLTEIDVQIPSYNAIGNPLYAIFEIGADGTMTARFIQKIPS